ncbi:MAG: sugar phosphate isomerase/epimerase [Bryobacteraceae bacterium]|nr:sugar phosphate isomerase/epimerase [Bryobacteraceae bacterium]
MPAKIAAGIYVFSQLGQRMQFSAEERAAWVFDTCRDAGYTAIELMNTYANPANAKLLQERGIKVPAVYSGGAVHEPDLAAKTIPAIVGLARSSLDLFQIEAIDFNPNPIGRAKSDVQLDNQAKAVSELASRLRELKLDLWIHQHAPELRDNAREWRHLMANTPAGSVRVCFDAHWFYRGGVDVMEHLKLWLPRINAFHLRNSTNKIWSESFGPGDVDYPAIAAEAKAAGWNGWLIPEIAWDEATVFTRSLTENLRLSREYAEKLFS